MKTNAFTMAETLITIGIIGIVAAMTIPSLIRKFNHIVLENQFKKSLATAQQVTNSAKIETGFDNFAKTCSTYKNGAYSTSELCQIALDNQIQKIKKIQKPAATAVCMILHELTQFNLTTELQVKF